MADRSIPDDVLDQAFYWAVVLGDTTVSAADRQAFDHWLRKNPLHQAAWQRLQVIEQEFSCARATAQQGSGTLRRVAGQRRRRRLAALGSLLSLLMIAGLAAFVPGHWRADHITGSGEQRHIALNGAYIRLNGRTALDVEDTASGPILHLRHGQILVESSGAEPGKKPRVVTDDGRFTPVGTRFIVDKLEDGSDLTVTEGRVDVDSGASTLSAIAGERWRVAGGTITAPAPNGLTPGAWVDNVIEANDARLGDVLAALGQYRSGWLRYGGEVAELRVTGVFRLDDSDGALATLEDSLPIRVRKTTDWWVAIDME